MDIKREDVELTQREKAICEIFSIADRTDSDCGNYEDETKACLLALGVGEEEIESALRRENEWNRWVRGEWDKWRRGETDVMPRYE